VNGIFDIPRAVGILPQHEQSTSSGRRRVAPDHRRATAQPNEQLFVTSDYTAPVLQVVAAMNPFWEPSIN
jgi:hypothetical protein